MTRFLNGSYQHNKCIIDDICPSLSQTGSRWKRKSYNVLSIDLGLGLSIKSHIERRSKGICHWHWRLWEMNSVDRWIILLPFRDFLLSSLYLGILQPLLLINVKEGAKQKWLKTKTCTRQGQAHAMNLELFVTGYR